MSNPIRSKKAFSLVEVIIAITVIVTVTAAALSVIYSSAVATRRSQNIAEAQSFAKDAFECFRAADSDEEFINTVYFAKGMQPVSITSDISEYTTFKYISDENEYVANIKIRFSEDYRSEFDISVTDKKGREITSFEFEKGDAQ